MISETVLVSVSLSLSSYDSFAPQQLCINKIRSRFNCLAACVAHKAQRAQLSASVLLLIYTHLVGESSHAESQMLPKRQFEVQNEEESHSEVCSSPAVSHTHVTMRVESIKTKVGFCVCERELEEIWRAVGGFVCTGESSACQTIYVYWKGES